MDKCEHANFTFILFLIWHEAKVLFKDMRDISKQQEKSIKEEITMLWCSTFKISFYDIQLVVKLSTHNFEREMSIYKSCHWDILMFIMIPTYLLSFLRFNVGIEG